MQRAARFGPGFVHETCGEKGAPTAQRARAGHMIGVNRIVCSLQYVKSRARVFRLEIIGKGVDKQQHFLVVRSRGFTDGRAQKIAAPLRQRPFRCQAEPAFADRSGARQALVQRGQPTQPADDWSVARQEGDEPLGKRQPVACSARRSRFDLELGHVDAGRTFALAALARYAQVERGANTLA